MIQFQHLEYHQLLKNDETFKTIIAPTFRPDGALFIERPTFASWIEKLTQVSGVNVDSFDALLTALKQRIAYFHENGGRASDHDIQNMEYVESTKQEIEEIFNKRLSGLELSD